MTILKAISERKPVLFLDFDGPLFSERGNWFPENNGSQMPPGRLPSSMRYWKMDPIAVAWLNKLSTEFDFEVVVSSAWREIYDFDTIMELFYVNGLKVKVANPFWCTKSYGTKNYSNFRHEEIAAYIRDHNIGRFIILDDPSSGSPLMEVEAYWPHFNIPQASVFLINPDEGVDFYTMQNIKLLLLKWKKDDSID